ncbi:MAG TPA: hypothetical protein IGS53_00570 [Leptolyngbyaceae cyanobacterium M33_DOE_097]|uniref:Uncharacterized protein n=1 Tax=Oscillatoriales cyanobacterium SpSt-418 TaxID=2282169 RepID=A0A7C3KGH3_9CYAN|nr:hypothetical protein [Leptolyngbyaceae cyanobacterium M33_DOE_097]
MKREFSQPSSPFTEEELNDLLSNMDIDQWLETLRHSDRSLYNLMALEVWSIAKTMDGLLPGFWNRFMANRQVSLKQFIQQRKHQSHQPTPDSEAPSSSSEA